jgi:alpha-glucosidase (family GH31 glycosyl hydrolase)
MNSYMDFTFDPVRFPSSEVQAFIQKLHANGQHYVVITDPGASPLLPPHLLLSCAMNTSISLLSFSGIHNLTGYAPYDQGLQQGVFIRNPDGTPYIGSVCSCFSVLHSLSFAGS